MDAARQRELLKLAQQVKLSQPESYDPNEPVPKPRQDVMVPPPQPAWSWATAPTVPQISEHNARLADYEKQFGPNQQYVSNPPESLDAAMRRGLGDTATDIAGWALGAPMAADDFSYAAGSGDPMRMAKAGAETGANLLAPKALGWAGEKAAPVLNWAKGKVDEVFNPKFLDPLAKLPGAPDTIEGPVPGVVQAAEDYASERGINLQRQSSYAKADPRRGKYIADEYEKMKHDPADPKVAASYKALDDETMAQWDALQKAGVKIEFMKAGEPDPYPGGPREALADLRGNNHLYVFPTTQGYGSGVDEALDVTQNPLLRDTGIVHGGHPMLVNDAFRAVHDVFGHGLEGANFGARGEENAWRGHSRLFSPEALPAITSETRGQNSWVNFGPFGEHNRANQRDTIFADQKTGVMPPWTQREEAMPLKYRAQQAGTAAALASALALAGSRREEDR